MTTWRRTTVGEFCPFVYGRALKESERTQTGEFPVMGSGGCSGTHRHALVDGPTSVVGRKGSVGRIYFAPDGCWPIDTTFYVPDDPSRDSRFVYYLLGSLGLSGMNSDSAVPGLNRDAAHAVSLIVPPLVEQRAIAGVLGALDDKIESNRRIGETFDKLVVTEYKRIQSQTSVSRKLLGEIVGKGLGGVWGTDVEEPGSDFCVACLRGIDLAKIASGTLPEVPKRWISQAQYLKRSLSGPEIWIEGSGSFCGRSLLVEPQLQGLFERPICYSNFVKRLVPIDDPRLMVPSWLSLRAAYESGEVGQLRIGSAFPNLDLDGVLSAVVVTIPESAELDRLVNLALLMVNPLQIRESQRLVELRDALLPELLSGRLRVRDAEKVVEEAV